MDTSLIDIYEASGATVNEDRTTVTMNSNQMRPFEIVLTVYPAQVIIDQDGERIIFDVLLDDDYAFEGNTVRRVQYSETSVELPVKQVRIHKKKKEISDGQ